MSRATGKAKHPHDATRPMSTTMVKALKKYEEMNDISEVYDNLTVRQRRFAEEYIIDYNATAAVVRAGYSPNHAAQQGSLLNDHEGVRAYIDHLTKSKATKIVSVSPEILIAKAMEIANKEGAKDSDKLRAVDMMMRHLGMFVDKQEITGKDGGAIEVQQQKVAEEASDFVTKMKHLAEKSKKTEVELV